MQPEMKRKKTGDRVRLKVPEEKKDVEEGALAHKVGKATGEAVSLSFLK